VWGGQLIMYRVRVVCKERRVTVLQERGTFALRFEDVGIESANLLYCHCLWLHICCCVTTLVPQHHTLPSRLLYMTTPPHRRYCNFSPLSRTKRQHTTMNPNHLDWSVITAQLSSHRAQLVLTAVASGVAVGTTLLAFQSARQSQKLRDIKSSIRSRDDATAVCSRQHPYAQRRAEI